MCEINLGISHLETSGESVIIGARIPNILQRPKELNFNRVSKIDNQYHSNVLEGITVIADDRNFCKSLHLDQCNKLNISKGWNLEMMYILQSLSLQHLKN
jgi:hypothetical protein